ncbi:DNA polymerase-3 subunit epsilon [Actinobaculum suis]|uniref:3'-5' exonuclease n=1 Tax=Actinobaculum suis TaxID=1657 RepID=A0A1G7BMU3_9ACTO|nr:3'-5' exonuclease [Actinobaculum suis]MDY5153781.1 3'-5' exonuclease [Actinobaculum suis]SDE28389.1 DNA polymerase-3 subunit epsilon [Actinobaculum suis]
MIPSVPSSSGFAVVDVETTGLDPRTDRIVQIGVVSLDRQGYNQGEWVSLVQPGRPMGATFVHGLTAQDVREAPSFTALIPQLEELLSGRAVVAHNAPFDVSFLNAAFERASYPFAIPAQATVCTMELSKIYLPEGRHSLPAAAERAGIQLTEHHRALADARAAAGLLQHYLQEEAKGNHYAEHAIARDGRVWKPAAWEGALRAAIDISWPEPLF